MRAGLDDATGVEHPDPVGVPDRGQPVGDDDRRALGGRAAQRALARDITAAVDKPTIGIGASSACDGQILVTPDMLGLFDWTPKFVRRYADLRSEVGRAVAAYAEDVKARRFPAEVETYFSKKPVSP